MAAAAIPLLLSVPGAYVSHSACACQPRAASRLQMTAADWLQDGLDVELPTLPLGVGEAILLPGQTGLIRCGAGDAARASDALEAAWSSYSCVGMPLMPTGDGSTLVTVLELLDAPTDARGVRVKCVGRALAPAGCRPMGGSSRMVPFADSTLELYDIYACADYDNVRHFRTLLPPQPPTQPRRAHVHPLPPFFLSLCATVRLRAGVRVAPCFMLPAAAEAAPMHMQWRASRRDGGGRGGRHAPPSAPAVHRVASHDNCEAVRRARLQRSGAGARVPGRRARVHLLGAARTDAPRARAPRLPGGRLAPAAGNCARAARRAMERRRRRSRDADALLRHGVLPGTPRQAARAADTQHPRAVCRLGCGAHAARASARRAARSGAGARRQSGRYGGVSVGVTRGGRKASPQQKEERPTDARAIRLVETRCGGARRDALNRI